jgi:hypothetical protein
MDDEEEWYFHCRPAYWLERTCQCAAFGMAHRPDQCAEYERIHIDPARVTPTVSPYWVTGVQDEPVPQWGVWRDNLHEDHGGEA